MRISTALAALMLCWFLVPLPARAQKEYDVWCMGDHSGIDFNGPVPTLFTSAINAFEGAASVADPATGQLLFYSDGVQAYNRFHLQMPNGNGLAGSINSTQSALIVPWPGNPTKYFLFTSDAGEYDAPPNEGIHYSTVDMNLDGGRGDIVTRNAPLLGVASEKLTAVRQADGCNYWVLCHGWNDNAFYAYPVGDGGVGAPVKSNVGSIHADPPGAVLGGATIGYMKASPDSRRLAVAIFAMHLVEVFDFDNRTGIVSNPISLPIDDEPYGVAFSPDNTKLYVSCQPNTLYQFDFANPNPAAVLASATLITSQVDPVRSERYGALQLAPDGRIYHAHSQIQWLAAIRNPNGKGSACDYSLHELDLGIGARMGLPNLIDGYFASGNLACGSPFANFAPDDSAICAGSCIGFTDLSTNSPTSWSWAFPGATPSTSTQRNPTPICFAAPGTYRVTLTASNDHGASTWSRDIVVGARGNLSAHINRDFTAVPGDTITVPLVLDASIDAAHVGDIGLTIQYGAGMLLLDTVGFENSLLKGWRIDSLVIDRAAGRCTAALTAPPGGYVQGTGLLANLRFRVFLGQSDTCSIRFDIGSSGNRCLAAYSDPGLVKLTICDAHDRLIELTNAGYTLGQSRPNPFNPTTVIPFSIGFPGRVTLTIHDALGRNVAALLNTDMPAGAYSIPWNAADYPSGLYYYTIESGEWRMTKTMMLLK